MKKYIQNLVLILVVTWATVMAVQYISEYFSPEPFAIEDLPEYLQLQSDPEDVLYSEAYDSLFGPELKYAYLANEVEEVEGEDITARTPVSRTEVLEVEQLLDRKREKKRTTFYPKPQFYDDNGTWRQIEYATTTPQAFEQSGAKKFVKKRELWERLLPGKPLFAVTSTFNPDPDVETSTVDGYTQASGNSLSSLAAACTSARNTTASVPNDTGTSITIGYNGITGYNNTCLVWRGFLLFDTASLDDGISIDSASIVLYIVGKSNTDSFHVVSSNPASNTGLTSPDTTTTGATNFRSEDSSGMTVSSDHTWPLNASGISNISLTGISKFGMRGATDFSNFTFLAGQYSISAAAAETSGTTQDPRLNVTYTVDTFSFGQWFPF